MTHELPELELHKRLVRDCQDSLAIALARLEAYRCRERVLARENQALRAALLNAGLRVDQIIKPQDEAAEDVGGPHVRASAELNAAITTAADTISPDALYITPMAGTYPIYYDVSGEKVPGSLIATEEALEFVETRARITAADFLGLRTESASTAHGWRDQSREGPSVGAGVISGTAAWLLQRVRRNSSTSGASAAGEASSTQAEESADSSHALPSLGEMMNSILHPNDAEEVESEASDVGGGDADEASVSWETPYGGALEPEDVRIWEVLWKTGGGDGRLQRLIFEASLATRAFLHKQVESWSVSLAQRCSDAIRDSDPGAAGSGATSLLERRAADAGPGPVQWVQRLMRASRSNDGSIRASLVTGLELELAEPRHMSSVAIMPFISEPSSILTDDQVRMTASVLPSRHRLAQWSLQYSSARHGISLQTLYRRAQPGPCLLFIRDTAGYIFGCFTPLPWRPSPRYYGTGETTVFQLQPHAVSWGWKRSKGPRNDFFMFAAPHSLGAGGGGHFAIFLDGDLLHGASGMSETFGNPCLASNPEFDIGRVEVWGLV